MEQITSKHYDSLEEWRKDHGFDHRQAAEFLGVSRSHYSNLERRNCVPRKSLRRSIIEKTGLSIEALIGAA